MRFFCNLSLLAVLAVLFVVSSAPAFALTSVSACGTLSVAGETYQLTANIADRNGTCFTIGANNITLDCQGYTVDGDDLGTDYGVYDNTYDGVTVKNCIITDFYHGIYFYNGANYGTIINNTVSSNNNTGIYIGSSSNYNTLTSNMANLNMYGIGAYSSSNLNTLTGNTANSNINTGFYIYISSNNTLTSNTADNNTNFGFYLATSSYNVLASNTIAKTAGARQQGLYISGSALAHFQNSVDTTNTVGGLSVSYYDGRYRACPNNTVQDLGSSYSWFGLAGCKNVSVTANNNLDHVLLAYTTLSSVTGVSASDTYFGISLYSSSNNTLTSNTASSNVNGIYLITSSNNTLTSNTASSNSNYGIYLVTSSNYNMLSGNTANSNTNYGIYLYSSSNYNTLTSNIANSNLWGINLYSTLGNTLTSSTTNSNWYGITISTSSGNIITNNIAQENNVSDLTVTATSDSHCNNVITGFTGSGGRPILYYNSSVNLQDQTLSKLILCNADYSSITNVTIDGSASLKNNVFHVVRTDMSNFTNINSYDNSYGIILTSSNNNIITSSNASSNNYGIDLAASSNNILIGNTVSSNIYDGIRLEFSSNNNTIYNNLFNNANNAYISASSGNVWNTTFTAGTNRVGGSWIGGNAWTNAAGTGFSDTCTDANGNGICDSAYTVASGNVDYLPLRVVVGYKYWHPDDAFTSAFVATGSVSGNLIEGTSYSSNQAIQYRDATNNYLRLRVDGLFATSDADMDTAVLSMQTLTSKKMAINMAGVTGIGPTYSIFVPVLDGAYVCPSVTTYDGVNSSCSGYTSWTDPEEMGVTKSVSGNSIKVARYTDPASGFELYNISGISMTGIGAEAPLGGVEVPDTTPPSITSAAITPSIVGTTAQITITKNVTDNVGVASVSAAVKNSGGTTVGTAALSLVSGDALSGTWQGTFTFTTQPDGTYTVTDTATDGYSNSAVVIDGTVMLDRTAPTVSIISITPYTTTLGGTITVTASASDTTSGMSSVTVQDLTAGTAAFALAFISGGSGPGQNGTWEGSFAAQTPTGNHTVEVKGYDNAANTNTAAGMFIVDTEGPAVIVEGAPVVWSTAATADVGCTDVSGCDSATYVMKAYDANPSTCPTDYSVYNFSTPWTRQFGTTGGDSAYGSFADSSGVYVVGSAGRLPNQSSSALGAFIRKYDGAGNAIWTNQFGNSSYYSIAYGVSVDSSGIYVAGDTTGALPGQVKLGLEDAFVRKYNATGSAVWTRQFGTAQGDHAYGVSVAPSGVFVVGFTNGNLSGQIGGADAFIRKYDTDGGVIWTRQFGTTGADIAYGVAVDPSGVYVAGYFGYAGFIWKYSFDGSILWARTIGTGLYDTVRLYSVSADSSGVYVSGSTNVALEGQISAGGVDAFVRKYDAAGNVVWTRQFGSNQTDISYGVSVDSEGVYVAGQTGGILPNQSSVGGVDAFVRKYSINGTAVWTKQFGTSVADYVQGVSANSLGVLTVGYTNGAFPGYNNSGSSDVFIRRYDDVTLPPYYVTSYSWWCAAAKDTLGNAGFSSPTSFDVDNEPPASDFTTPSDGEILAGTEFTGANGPATDLMPGSGVNEEDVTTLREADALYWDGSGFVSEQSVYNPGTITSGQGTGSAAWEYIDISLDPDYSYAMSARSIDVANNVESTAVSTFAVITDSDSNGIQDSIQTTSAAFSYGGTDGTVVSGVRIAKRYIDGAADGVRAWGMTNGAFGACSVAKVTVTLGQRNAVERVLCDAVPSAHVRAGRRNAGNVGLSGRKADGWTTSWKADLVMGAGLAAKKGIETFTAEDYSVGVVIYASDTFTDAMYTLVMQPYAKVTIVQNPDMSYTTSVISGAILLVDDLGNEQAMNVGDSITLFENGNLNDFDGDGVLNADDACDFKPGIADFQGCPAAIMGDDDLHVYYHQVSGYACIKDGKQQKNCKLDLKLGLVGDSRGEAVIVAHKKVFKLSDLGVTSFGQIKDNCKQIYDGTYPTGGAPMVNEKDAATATELVGVPEPGDYVVIERVHILDGSVERFTTVCKPVETKDFNHDYNKDGTADPVAKRKLKVMKTVAALKGGGTTVELKPADDVIITGSQLTITYPTEALWEEGVNQYVYPYIFASDSDWTVDVCTYAPEGYTITGVYDELGNLIASSNCAQAFVAGQAKVAAFEVVKTGSPKKFTVGANIEATPKGKAKKTLTLTTDSEIVPKEQLKTEKKAQQAAEKGLKATGRATAYADTGFGGGFFMRVCELFGIFC